MKRLTTRKSYCLSVLLLSTCSFLPNIQAQNKEAERPVQTAGNLQTVYSDVIYFSRNEGDWIEQSEYKKAGRMLRWALSDTITPITITGWTDPTGTETFNEQLSLRRARTVRNYLVSKGVAAGRIRIEGRGVDTQAANDDEARRAEIAGVIYLSAKSVPDGKVQEAEETTPTVAEKETEQVREVQEIKEEVQQEEQQVVQAVEPVQQEVKSEPERTDKPMKTDESVSVSQTSSRYVAVKTNLAAWAGTIMNLAADVQVSEHISVELPVLWCPWYVSDKHAVKTFILQPEGRYWLARPGEGHFFGVHAHVGWFNVKWNRDRYQDTSRPLLGAGISYGYLLPLGEHWAGEFTLGAGYANLKYNTYYNIGNGARIDTRTKNYWGITRVGISVVYRFNLK
ncbi:DUF3575 domain-containing protein [Bacteroides fragilis]|uniref:DUF3575 domain-containing protein n=1 Tax=Bacteroides fragilis TaxID=817 RepID=A0ABD4VQC5_BACFG|nr:DUF3575 domain-containing protein [Bacteroides fragilis]MCM0237040.1 DUF3575 domain-containing protein [Bacteroides fragilis]MCZ2653669.1 DUF3575 domain-containing protein [Bacteroides fragilis]